jgi:ABC-type lipoprotein release transport system permease subunit
MNAVRYSVRSLVRTPGSTLALFLSIALGVGSNAAVHGFANGFVAGQSPLVTAEGRVSLFVRDREHSVAPFEYDEYLSIRKRHDLFEWVGSARDAEGILVRDQQSIVVSAASVTPELATLLELPLRGGVVIAHRLWRSDFKAGRVVGETIRLDGVDYRVDEVAPQRLEGLFAGSGIDVWMQMRDESVETDGRAGRRYWVFGQLQPGIAIDAARSALNAGRAGAAEIGIVRYTGMTPELMDGLGRIASVLELASTAVFLIACANVGSFLLGRASARARETSVRVALGASRSRLARQLLSDSILLSIAGGACGLLVAFWTADVIPALFFAEDAERLVFAPDTLGTWVTAIVCAALAVACGLLPILETRADRPAVVLQRESAGSSKRTRRIRTGLVVMQMTFCCVLATSSGFLLHGFRASVQTGLGRELGSAILASVQTTAARGPTYFEEIEAAAQAMNAVSEWAWTGRLPGGRPVWQPLRIEPSTVPLREVTINVAAFTPDSLSSVTLPPVAGRMFAGRDTPGSCRVAIVNEEGAKELFEGDAAGRWVQEITGGRVEIIGIVSAKPTNAGVHPAPTLYYYANQMPAPNDWRGPKRFRVTATRQLSTAVLDAQVVSANYFGRMGFRTLAGEVFTERSRRAACRVAVLNQEAADRYFGGGAVGAAVIDATGRRTEIVGVVQAPSLQLFARTVEPAIYYPMTDDFVARMTLILSAANVDQEWLTNLRRRLEAVPGAIGPPAVRTLATHLRQTALAPLRMVTVLVSALSLMALVLAVLGVYSALSDSARQRRRDIALRMAFGAQGWRIIRQVAEEGGRLAALGILLGMLLSVAALRWIGPMIPGGVTTNLWVWLTAPLTVIGAVVAASVVPAIRALGVDPLVITRDER